MKRILTLAALMLTTLTPAFAGGVTELPMSTAVANVPNYTIVADGEGNLYAYSTKPKYAGQLVGTIRTTVAGGINDLVVSPNNRYIAVIGKRILALEPFQTTGIVEVYDLVTGRLTYVPVQQTDDHHKQCVAFSQDSKICAVLFSGRVSLWHIQTGQPISHPATGINEVESVSFAPGGDILITAGKQGTQMWHGVKNLLVPVRSPKNFGRRPQF